MITVTSTIELLRMDISLYDPNYQLEEKMAAYLK